VLSFFPLTLVRIFINVNTYKIYNIGLTILLCNIYMHDVYYNTFLYENWNIPYNDLIMRDITMFICESS